MSKSTEMNQQEVMPIANIKKESLPPPTRVYSNNNVEIGFSFEEKIYNFLRSRGTSEYIKLNDFLKSLYPLPLMNTPPEWAKQGSNKKLKALLEKMQAEGKITIQNDQHRKLGTFFYESNNPVTQYYNLKNIIIEARI